MRARPDQVIWSGRRSAMSAIESSLLAQEEDAVMLAVAEVPVNSIAADASFLPLVNEFVRQRGPTGEWCVDARSDAGSGWISCRHADSRMPAQGWKLHVSAGVATAAETLRRVLPIVLAEDISFKVAGSPGALG